MLILSIYSINLLDLRILEAKITFLKLRRRSRFQSIPSDSMALLRLVSCDGLEVDLLNSKTIARLVSLSHKVDILESVAMQSKVLKEMLDNCSPVMAEGNSIVEEEVPLPTIHSEQLKIIARLIKKNISIVHPDNVYGDQVDGGSL